MNLVGNWNLQVATPFGTHPANQNLVRLDNLVRIDPRIPYDRAALVRPGPPEGPERTRAGSI